MMKLAQVFRIQRALLMTSGLLASIILTLLVLKAYATSHLESWGITQAKVELVPQYSHKTYLKYSFEVPLTGEYGTIIVSPYNQANTVIIAIDYEHSFL